MKYLSLICVTATLFLFTSCEQDGGKNAADYSLATDPDFKQIATAFRSESEIVVAPGAEDYMGQFNHKVLLDDIFEAIYAGKIIAYDFYDEPLSIEDVKYLHSHTDTAEIENIETGEVEEVLITEELNPDDVVKIFTIEDWYLNKETFEMEKKIISMTLTTLKLDLEGEIIGHEIIFKIYLDGRDQAS